MKIPNIAALLAPIGISYQRCKLVYQLGSAGACAYAIHRVFSKQALGVSSLAAAGVVYYCWGSQLRSYLVDKVDNFIGDRILQFLFPTAAEYQQQVKALSQENQKTEKQLLKLQEVNQRLTQLKEKMASELTIAEQQMENARQKVSAEHEHALKLQQKANEVCGHLGSKVDELLAEAKRLCEIYKDILPEAVEVLNEFQECQKLYKDAFHQSTEAKNTMEAAVIELQELSPLLKQLRAEEVDLLRQLHEQPPEKI